LEGTTTHMETCISWDKIVYFFVNDCLQTSNIARDIITEQREQFYPSVFKLDTWF